MADGAAKYDLTLRVSKFLDRHLVFPLLEFLSSRELYDVADIEQAKLELIERTNMVDYAVDIYQQLHGTDEVRRRGDGRERHAAVPRGRALSLLCATQVPESLVVRRREVVDKLRSLEQQVKPITDFLSSEENVRLLKSDKTQNMTFLQKEFNIGAEAACLHAAAALCGGVGPPAAVATRAAAPRLLWPHPTPPHPLHCCPHYLP